MKKTLSIILALTLIVAAFAGCAPAPITEVETTTPSGSPEVVSPDTTASDKPEIVLSTLKGPTTMGLVGLLDKADMGELDYTVANTIYGTADEVTGLITSGETNMAAIPCNLASVLYNKTEGAIQVAAINTLGVLYVVELGDSVKSVADLAGKTVYSTGKGTTPEYTLNAILKANGLDPASDLTVEYKSEATEIAALLAGESAVAGTIAVLPQPYAATVLAKNPDARIALSLSDEWTAAGLEGSMVTGVLVVNRQFAADNPELVASFLSDYADSVEWVNANTAEAAKLIADAGIVGDAAIAEKALPQCNIVFQTGDEMKTNIGAYLSVLFEQEPKSVGGKLPDDSFYYAG